MGKQALFLILGLLLILAGCGHKAPPIVPKKLLAGPVEMEEVRVRPGRVLLFFRLPSKYVKGGKIDTLCYEVKRCLGSKCDHVKGGREEAGKKVVVIDNRIKEGLLYKYRIIPKVHSPGIPVEVNVRIGPFPGSPINLRAHPAEGIVELRWEGNATRFRIYRRERGEEEALAPLILVEGKKYYRDIGVENGVTYLYTLRAVKLHEGVITESNASKTVEATPRDMTPPPSPQGLTCHYREGMVFIAWDPVKAKDLAGYYLYKRSDKKRWHRVTREVIGVPLYVDKKVVSGGTYFYKVVAVDEAGNISRPSQIVAVGVTSRGR